MSEGKLAIILFIILILAFSGFLMIKNTYQQYHENQELMQLEREIRRERNEELVNAYLLIGESVTIEEYSLGVSITGIVHIHRWISRIEDYSRSEVMNILASEDVIITGTETTNSVINLAWWESQGYSRSEIISILMSTNHQSYMIVLNFLRDGNNPDRRILIRQMEDMLENPEIFTKIQANFDYPDLAPDTFIAHLPMDVLVWLLEQVLGGQ